jgi:hypothetical protein
VYEENGRTRVVGTLFLRDAVGARLPKKAGRSAQSDCIRASAFVHEDFAIRQVLQAFGPHRSVYGRGWLRRLKSRLALLTLSHSFVATDWPSRRRTILMRYEKPLRARRPPSAQYVA